MNTRKILVIALFSVLLGGALSFANGVFSWESYGKDSPAQHMGESEVKNSPYYPVIDFYNLKSNDHLTIISQFKTGQQETEFSCGPSAAKMVVGHYLGKALHSEEEMAKIMNTSTTKGTDLHGMTKYFKQIGWKVKSTFDSKTPKSEEEFQKFVLTNLKKNIPIIVENIDWGGHWRIIIGYDTMGTELMADDVLIVADPYDTTDHHHDGYGIVPAQRFYYMWFDNHLFKEGERDKNWLIAVPK